VESWNEFWSDMRAKTNYSIIDASVKTSPKNNSFTETIQNFIFEKRTYPYDYKEIHFS